MVRAYGLGVITLAIALAAWGGAGKAQDTRLRVSGGGEDLEDALDEASLVREIGDDAADATAQDYVAAARADYRRLLTALYAEGYYGGAISIEVDGTEAASIQPLAAPTSIDDITIRVEPGPRFSFGRIDVAPLAPGSVLPEAFLTGQPAEAAVIRDAARAVVISWREIGHAKAEIGEQEVIARHPAEQLDVALRVLPGPRLSFGPLIVEGNENVRTERIIAIAGLPTGEVFSPEALLRAQERLRRTGAFTAVALEEAEDIAPGDTLPIIAQIAEDEPRRIGFGIEVNSVEGLTVSAFWLHRNLLGGAERFRIEAEATGLTGTTEGTDYELSATFNRPATFAADTDFYATASISQIDDPGYFIQQVALEAGLTRYVSDDLQVAAGVGLLTAHVEDDLGNRDYTLLTLPLEAEWDLRNVEGDATAGYYLQTELTPFVGIAGSESGGRLYVDARAYRSFGADDRVTFAGRLQFGSVFSIEPEDAPADFLFFSGGGGTVRGQEYQALGIELDGAEIGGTSFLGAQLEARVGVTRRIGAVAFYDVGLVGDSAYPEEDDEHHAGAGLGIRYNTRIGPIRVDVATPVTGDDAGEGVKLYVGIGQAF